MECAFPEGASLQSCMIRYPALRMTNSSPRFSKEETGLCADCRNARPIRSAKGSMFLLCELAASDPRFAKYPRLPVLQCAGYAPVPGANPPGGHS